MESLVRSDVDTTVRRDARGKRTFRLAALAASRASRANGPEEPVEPDESAADLDRDADRAPLERLLVRENGRLVVVRLADVDWIEGAGNYVRIHAGERTLLFRQTMNDLEKRLDPTRFARIHRSTIVHVDRIAELRPTISGAYDVLLSNGEKLTLSRGHRRRALELVAT